MRNVNSGNLDYGHQNNIKYINESHGKIHCTAKRSQTRVHQSHTCSRGIPRQTPPSCPVLWKGFPLDSVGTFARSGTTALAMSGADVGSGGPVVRSGLRVVPRPSGSGFCAGHRSSPTFWSLHCAQECHHAGAGRGSSP